MSTSAPTAAEHQTPGAQQIARAKSLEKQRGELQGLITANRDFLRLMAKNEMLTAAEKKFVEVFYPDKEKGSVRSDEEIEATKKARDAARKG